MAISWIAIWIDSTVPWTSTILSVDWGNNSFEATILTPEVSWICLILIPCLPITVPIKLWDMSKRIAVVAEGGERKCADEGFKGLSNIVRETIEKA